MTLTDWAVAVPNLVSWQGTFGAIFQRQREKNKKMTGMEGENHEQNKRLLKPWARFKMISKEPAEESDHIYFLLNTHKIGRNRTKADVLLDFLFVSGLHCIVNLEGKNEDGKPIVRLQDFRCACDFSFFFLLNGFLRFLTFTNEKKKKIAT